MREFIRGFEDEENVEAILETLEDQILISKGHSNTKKYPVVKRWFLRRYPNYAEFGMDVEELSAWGEKLKKEDEEFNKLSSFRSFIERTIVFSEAIAFCANTLDLPKYFFFPTLLIPPFSSKIKSAVFL